MSVRVPCVTSRELVRPVEKLSQSHPARGQFSDCRVWLTAALGTYAPLDYPHPPPESDLVPLTKQALPLSASPRAVADARRWVRDICVELGREDLVECAELGVSELTTNAVLHGAEPIAVRVRGTTSHPRIEVIDGSSQPPTPPTPSSGPGGLPDDLRSRALDRGHELGGVGGLDRARRQGRVVRAGDRGPRGRWRAGRHRQHRRRRAARGQRRRQGGPLPRRRPAAGYSSLTRQYYELRRELRLLAVAHQDHYPLAADLSAMFASYERQVPDEIHRAVRSAGERRGPRPSTCRCGWSPRRPRSSPR